MKAAFVEQFGGPEVLKYGDLPDPVAAAGEVVVDVVAASVNGADWKIRRGQYSQAVFPLVLGRDFSGLVAAAAAGIDDLKVGDAVFGVLEAGREGAYAEKLAIKAAIVAKKPDGLSHVNAAALALTGLTAISAIETTLQLKRGETILIQGGAGGTKAVSGCDAVFDTVGGDVAQRSFAVLKPGGRAAFIASGAQAPKPDRTVAFADQLQCFGFAVAQHRGGDRRADLQRFDRHCRASTRREERSRRASDQNLLGGMVRTYPHYVLWCQEFDVTAPDAILTVVNVAASIRCCPNARRKAMN